MKKKRNLIEAMLLGNISSVSFKPLCISAPANTGKAKSDFPKGMYNLMSEPPSKKEFDILKNMYDAPSGRHKKR